MFLNFIHHLVVVLILLFELNKNDDLVIYVQFIYI